MFHEAKCIYCFEYVQMDKVHFRAKARVEEIGLSLVEQKKEDYLETDDLILGRKTKRDNPSAAKVDDGTEVDLILKDFLMKRYKLDEKAAEAEADKFPAYSVGSSIFEKRAIRTDPDTQREYYTTVSFDPKKVKSEIMTTDECLCPHCHNRLPTGFGVIDTLIVSIIGDTFSGKTVYIASLIHELQLGTNYFSSSLVSRTPKTGRNLMDDIDSIIRRIFVEHGLPGTTQVRLNPPMIYDYRYTYISEESKEVQKALLLVLYDIAGECCRDPIKLEQIGTNVKNSDGIIYLLNPLAIDKISAFYQLKGYVTDDTRLESQLEVIASIYNNFLAFDNDKCDIPLALTISKSDIFSDDEVVLPFFRTHPYSQVLPKNNESEDMHKGYINKNVIQNMNDDVKEFLAGNGAVAFVNAIHNAFTDYCHFAVSALNQNPVKSNGTQKLERDIIPYKVTDPFYWILAKKGYISMRSPIIQEAPKKGLSKGLFQFIKKIR